MEFTEATIADVLRNHYYSTSKYFVENAYIFKNDWESDVFLQKQNSYTYEIEIKISRTDFKADAKKTVKHSILSKGEFTSGTYTHKWERRPNRFYYAVPEGLITTDEVPAYAGLIYISETGGLTVVKQAPFIHKEKLRLETTLCEKFYYYWRNVKHELHTAKREIKNLENKLQQMRELQK